jgi:hypothetical protein
MRRPTCVVPVGLEMTARVPHSAIVWRGGDFDLAGYHIRLGCPVDLDLPRTGFYVHQLGHSSEQLGGRQTPHQRSQDNSSPVREHWVNELQKEP